MNKFNCKLHCFRRLVITRQINKHKSCYMFLRLYVIRNKNGCICSIYKVNVIIRTKQDNKAFTIKGDCRIN